MTFNTGLDISENNIRNSYVILANKKNYDSYDSWYISFIKYRSQYEYHKLFLCKSQIILMKEG